MISEKQFAISHAAFWHQLFPMAEEYVRIRNQSLNEFLSPLTTVLLPRTRAVVNEIGFRLFVASLQFRRIISSVPSDAIDACVRDGLLHIRFMRENGRKPVLDPGAKEIDEARVLAERLVVFFNRVTKSTLVGFPAFAGCGWVDDCSGDVLAGGTLFEVKAGERLFRSIDLRQILIYAALDFAAKTFGIVNVCLVNPRIGVFWHEPLEHLCQNLAGRHAPEVLGDIVDYMSEPSGRYVSD